MLGAAVSFFLIAVIAAVFGFTDIATATAAIAQILFYLFLVFFLISLVIGALRGGWNMFYLAVLLFLIAAAAAWLGYSGVAADLAVLAKGLFVLFFFLFLISLVIGFIRRAAGGSGPGSTVE